MSNNTHILYVESLDLETPANVPFIRIGDDYVANYFSCYKPEILWVEGKLGVLDEKVDDINTLIEQLSISGITCQLVSLEEMLKF